MLTARGSVSDKVEGLAGGADDYLVKPFSFDELSGPVSKRYCEGRHLCPQKH